jgi:hypothetical protein
VFGSSQASGGMPVLNDLYSCRMGIHTGYCTVGNFGSEDRVNARSFGRSDDPTTTAEDCDDSVDLVGDLVANILKNADF